MPSISRRLSSKGRSRSGQRSQEGELDERRSRKTTGAPPAFLSSSMSSITGPDSIGSDRQMRHNSFSSDPGAYVTEDTVSASPPSPSLSGASIKSMESNLSTTPPKKAWEFHYKSFLSRLAPHGSGQGHAPAGLIPPDKWVQEKKAQRLIDRAPVSGNSSLSNSYHNMLDNTHHSSPDILEAQAKLLLLQQQQQESGDTEDEPPGPPAGAAQQRTRTHSGESAVRGGSLFKSVFKHRNRSHSSSSDTPSLTMAKSSDTLDSTVRRGMEKNVDALRLHDTSSNHHKSSPHLAGLAPPVPPPMTRPGPPPMTRRDSLDINEVRDVLAPLRRSPSRHSFVMTENLVLDEQGVPIDLVEQIPFHPLSRSNRPVVTRELKMAFTEFHNSTEVAKDSTSPFLGDESSVYENDYFGVMFGTGNHAATSRTSSHGKVLNQKVIAKPRSLPTALLPTSVSSASTRILEPLRGPETWSTGRRHLIGPAVLSMCPIEVLSIFSGKHPKSSKEGTSLLSDMLEQTNITPENNDNNREDLLVRDSSHKFGMTVLGKATVSLADLSKELGVWSTSVFVLRQNFLLEYEEGDNLAGRPRGFAHLDNAIATSDENSTNALQLEYYLSPCLKDKSKTIMIRLAAEAKERDYWVQQLNEAAQLTIESLYDYDEDVMFGKGRYATVHPAKRKFEKSSDNSYDCTLKIVDKVEFWRRVKKTRERPDTLVREAATQATLSAKCGNVDSILRLSGFFETSENVVLEFEILEGTDLFQYVSKKGVLEELEAAHIMNDIMTGLQTMRRLGIAHRDIKPANVLMCNKEKHGVFVKVADFGMAAFAGVDDLVRGRCGTPGYVAPEIFHAGMNNGYACGVDVFSAGVTLYVLLCGYEPFYGESDAELIEANKDADVDFSESDWDNVSKEARDLVSKMLNPDPSKRINIEEVLKHPWLANRRSSDVSSITQNDTMGDAACTVS